MELKSISQRQNCLPGGTLKAKVYCLLKCGKNVIKGTISEVCYACNMIEDAKHRIKVFSKYRINVEYKQTCG